MSDRIPDEISECMSAQKPDECQQEFQSIDQIISDRMPAKMSESELFQGPINIYIYK